MTSTSQDLPVLIIGAGISGLSLAALLTKYSILFCLYESSSRSHSQGYAIALRSWAYRPLLQALEVSDYDFRATTATDAAIGGSGNIDAHFFDAHTGHVLSPATKAEDGEEVFRANRGRIREFLMGNIDPKHVVWEKSLVDVSHNSDFVIAKFADGEEAKGRMIIAADGVHSTGEPLHCKAHTFLLTGLLVRKIFVPNVDPSPVDATVYNWLRTVSRLDYDHTIGPYMRGTNVIVSAAESTSLGCSLVDITRDSVRLSWTICLLPTSAGSADSTLDTIEANRPSQQGLNVTIQAHLSSLIPLAPPFDDLLERTLTQDDELYHWQMRKLEFPRPNLDALAAKRILFIGDAVHSMPIFAGEGGNHAILDAVEMARLLVEPLPNDVGDELSGTRYYDGAWRRWQTGIQASEARFAKLCRPMVEWREIAEKVKVERGEYLKK